MSATKTARAALIEVFEAIRPETDRWIAVHEMPITDHSQNAMATMLSTMSREGLVVGRLRSGKKFKEWRPAPNLVVKTCAPFPEHQEDA